jgi:putative addiction module component (TIGR02574 family)
LVSKRFFTTEVFDMTARAEQVLSEALSLAPSERAQLAERLFSSLDISQQEIDRLWAQEADSRIDAYNRGDIKAVSAKDVFKNISQR